MTRVERLGWMAAFSCLACGAAPDESTDESSDGSSTEVVTTITPDDADDDDGDDDDDTGATDDDADTAADTSTGEPPALDMCERFDELLVALPRASADEQSAL